MKRRLALKIRKRWFAHSRVGSAAGYNIGQLERAWDKVGDPVGMGIPLIRLILAGPLHTPIGSLWDKAVGEVIAREDALMDTILEKIVEEPKTAHCDAKTLRGMSSEAWMIDQPMGFPSEENAPKLVDDAGNVIGILSTGGLK